MTWFAATENASLPAVTLTVGSPNRFASAGVRMKGPFRPRMHLGYRAVGMYGGLPRPVHGLGNGLASLQVRERGRDSAGEKKGLGPVRGLEDLGVLLVDRERHPELEPAVQCWQGKGRAGRGLPFGSPAGEGRRGRHHPAQHAQQRAERRDHSQSSPHGDHPHSTATTLWPVARIFLRPPGNGQSRDVVSSTKRAGSRVQHEGAATALTLAPSSDRDRPAHLHQ